MKNKLVDLNNHLFEQFKRDLRSYTYHQKKAMEMDEKLEELAVKMQGG